MTKANEAQHQDSSDDTGEIRDVEIFAKYAMINFLRGCIRDAEAGISSDLPLKIPNLATLFGVVECKKALMILKAMGPSEFGQILDAMGPSEPKLSRAVVKYILNRPL